MKAVSYSRLICVIGQVNSGKTTIVRRLKTRNYESVSPTIQLDVQLVDREGEPIIYFDLGGDPIVDAPLWEERLSQASGVLFVIDATQRSPTRIREAKRLLFKVAEWSRNQPLAIFTNKCDNPDTLTEKEITQEFEFFNLPDVDKREFNVFRGSALTGENIEDAIQWLIASSPKPVIDRSVQPLSAILYDTGGQLLATAILQEPSIDPRMTAAFLKALTDFCDNLIANEKPRVILTDEFQLVTTWLGELGCTLIASHTAWRPKLFLLAEKILINALPMKKRERTISDDHLKTWLTETKEIQPLTPQVTVETSLRELEYLASIGDHEEFMKLLAKPEFLQNLEEHCKNNGLVKTIRYLSNVGEKLAETIDPDFPLEYDYDQELWQSVENKQCAITDLEPQTVHHGEGIISVSTCPFQRARMTWTSLGSEVQLRKLPQFYRSVMGDPVTSPFCVVHQRYREKVASRSAVGGRPVFCYQVCCGNELSGTNLDQSEAPRETVENLCSENHCVFIIRSGRTSETRVMTESL